MQRPRPARPVHRHEARIQRLLARAEAAAERGDTDKAEALLRAGLTEHPDHSMVPMELGLLLDASGRHGEAEVFLTSAAAHGDAVCLTNLAAFLANRGRHAEAVAHFEQVRTQVLGHLVDTSGDESPHSDDPERWLLGAIEVALAESLAALGRTRQSEALLDSWADHPEHGPDVRRLRGDDEGGPAA